MKTTETKSGQQPGVRRTDMQRHDLDMPGWEVIQTRVDIDEGVLALKHTHPGDEIVYVLEGSLSYQIEGEPPATLGVGDVVFVQAGAVHGVNNVGAGNGSELATSSRRPIVALAE
jgi:quercetin dioxygenase-like cupin family protein